MSKQETLEEAIKIEYETRKFNSDFPFDPQSFKLGAKWQQDNIEKLAKRKEMNVYKELETMGFFDYLYKVHKLQDSAMNPEYLDKYPMSHIHKTVVNCLVFRWFREQFNWQSSIEATKDQHSHELGFNYWIWNSETGEEHHTMPKNKPSGDWCYKTYEEAQKECIMDLILIIKNQKK